METLTREVSNNAFMEFLREGKLNKQETIICQTLEILKNPVTAWGMSKKCELSYHQIDRRLKRLREINAIKIVCKLRDNDGSVRAAYKLV